MYVLMFITVLRLRKSQPDHERGYRVPAVWLVAGTGLVSSVLVFFVGLIPPSQFGNGNPLTYAALLLGGVLLIGFGIPGLFLLLSKPSWIGTGEEVAAEEGGAA